MASLLKEWGSLPYVVDQNDYIRHGCSRYPYSCFFCDVLRLLDAKKVLDLTYGEGRFYQACKSEVHVTGIDIVKHEWAVEPDIFIQDDAFLAVKKLKREYDVAVIDPPFDTEPNNHNPRKDVYYASSNSWNIHKLVQLIKLAKAYVAPTVIVKYLPKEWDELTHLFALQPQHVFIFKYFSNHARPSRFRNVKTFKNFSMLFLFSSPP